MKPLFKKSNLLTATSTLMCVGLSASALASVNLQSVTPAQNSSYSLTEDALLHTDPRITKWDGYRFTLGVNYHFLDQPLVETNTARTQRNQVLIDGVHTLDLGAGLQLSPRFTVGLAVPLNLIHPTGEGNQFAIGDTRALLKFRLTPEDSILAVSLIPELRLPTGSTALLLSDGGISGGVRLAFERDFGPLRASANLGFLRAPQAIYRDLDVTSRLPLALGLYIPIGDRWAVNTEAAGALSLPLDRFHNPAELYAGVRYRAAEHVSVSTGLSLGSFNSVSSSDYRIVAGIRFAPGAFGKIEAPAPKVEQKPLVQAAPAPAPSIKPAPAPVLVKSRVIYTPTEIKITEEVQFKHASSELTPAGKSLLDEVADTILKHRKQFRKIRVEGHTNEIGGLKFNQLLSEARAASVRDYLGTKGVDFYQLETRGYGKTRPKQVSGISKATQLLINRRVEFKVIQ
jgi:outer membrane protein OmpA-like peptidoglycan-associated protein